MSGGRARLRPRLSRTVSRSRWAEYERLLRTALGHGYEVVSLEPWLREPAGERPVLILRHDVDQHPAAALRMASIERELGLRSTWYLRWRTAHPTVVRRLREGGHDTGLHYETLSRRAAALGLATTAGDEELLSDCRRELMREIAAFARLHGPIRSVCPHGDSRVPGVRNGDLLRGQDPVAYGVEYDGNQAMAGRRLAGWITDRSLAEGGWSNADGPWDLLAAGASPILTVTHPNNWVSGPALWADRGLAAALRATPLALRPILTGADEPPTKVA